MRIITATFRFFRLFFAFSLFMIAIDFAGYWGLSSYIKQPLNNLDILYRFLKVFFMTFPTNIFLTFIYLIVILKDKAITAKFINIYIFVLTYSIFLSLYIILYKILMHLNIDLKYDLLFKNQFIDISEKLAIKTDIINIHNLNIFNFFQPSEVLHTILLNIFRKSFILFFAISLSTLYTIYVLRHIYLSTEWAIANFILGTIFYIIFILSLVIFKKFLKAEFFLIYNFAICLVIKIFYWRYNYVRKKFEY